MIRFTQRQLAATMVLAASAWLTPSLAAEAPAAPAAATAPRPYAIPPRTPDYIKNAIQMPRPLAMLARDADRRPAEVLSLSGIRPGNKVILLGVADLYYATLVTEIVGPKGMVYMYDLPNWDEVFGDASRKFAAAHPNTSYQGVDLNKTEFPRAIDVVINVDYFTEMLKNNVDMDLFQSKIFKNMKAGGTYLVAAANADIGRDMRETLKLDRLDPSVTRATAQGGGFQMREESRVLQNLDDDHSSPARSKEMLDKTDLALYVFRKPIIY